MSIILPKKVRSIIAVMNEAGFPAHIVGGCVRDLVMQKAPHDWDITTSASPIQVKELFGKSWDTGLKHGTVTVNFEGQFFEITTWRKDMAYNDHRHPDRVEFTNSLEVDLFRRDFTMNAIAYHPDEGLIDPFHGMDDIKNRLIRSVGDPIKRFGEDALRMLRAIRFSAQLGFEIEARTYAAIGDLHKDINYVSFERIQGELNKILESENPCKLRLIWDTGLNTAVFPDICPLPELCIKACMNISPAPENRVLILSALFYGAIGGNRYNSASSALLRLKYDNDTVLGVINTLKATEITTAPTERNRRRACKLYGSGAVLNAGYLLLLERSKTGEVLRYPKIALEESIENSLSGSDLIAAGLNPGKEIGMILSTLELCLFEKPELNDRETLMMLAKAIHSKIRYITVNSPVLSL